MTPRLIARCLPKVTFYTSKHKHDLVIVWSSSNYDWKAYYQCIMVFYSLSNTFVYWWRTYVFSINLAPFLLYRKRNSRGKPQGIIWGCKRKAYICKTLGPFNQLCMDILVGYGDINILITPTMDGVHFNSLNSFSYTWAWQHLYCICIMINWLYLVQYHKLEIKDQGYFREKKKKLITWIIWES